MDIVILVRPGDSNPELRFCLRSLRNIEFDRLFISGYRPNWVRSEETVLIPNNLPRSKNNEVRNILNAINCNFLSENFILFNDDFYVMKKTKMTHNYNRGSIQGVADMYHGVFGFDTKYVRIMRATNEVIKDWGVMEPKSFELHLPLLVNKTIAREMLKRLAKDKINIINGNNGLNYHFRSLYGNYAEHFYGIKSEFHKDVKLYRPSSRENAYGIDQDLNFNFFSTQDNSFHFAEDKLKKFVRASQYEKPIINPILKSPYFNGRRMW